MAEEPTQKDNKKYVSTANIASNKTTKASLTASARQSQRLVRLDNLLTIVSAMGAALLTTSGLSLVQLLETQALSTFFQIRGPLVPPEDIVILAIDDQSISIPEQYYKTDSQKYAYLEPLIKFPFKRAAYAQVVEKLMQAGAKSVALDVVFDLPGSYGDEDDRQLQAVLQTYGSKITLAAQYEISQSHQGIFTQLRLPYEKFLNNSLSIGTVNFPVEVDGKVHRLASEFPKLLSEYGALTDKIPSFDQAVLGSAQVKYPQPEGERIYFWGPPGTFEPIPFWYVLDPQNWNTYLQQGKVFQNKIVIIGATAQLANDYHPVAVANNWLSPERMSGVEIHANAIATVMQGKAIAQAIKSPTLQALFVLALVGGASFIITKSKSGLKRFILSITVASGWASISYVSFVYAQLLFPTTIPMLAIAFCGISYLGTEIAREKIRTRQIVDIFQKYKTSPVVQEIISQQQELQDLLQQRYLAVSGKILSGRYKIVKVLGSGGFSETYIAEDTQRPGNPRCVVKQLKPANTQAKGLELARRLFHSEAQTLERLGTHHNIPQLLAYFEQEAEFYLVQEYIIGHPLSRELPSGRGIMETDVSEIVRELLQILVFIHENGVIHRDIKPSNIIRRDSDGKLVLIDFGAVKEISSLHIENQEQTPFTIGIGTKGYAPSEQCFGRPQYNSDIYAVGMIGIKALTGIAPHDLPRDDNEEVKWSDKAFVSDDFAQILSKMVRDDFKQRYQSASEVLAALNQLANSADQNFKQKDDSSMNTLISIDEEDLPTAPWP
ncbi:CHASE2 domain-containing serine/threonine-protein kinase [Anabaena subtropica]|uniref:non-specific serine/threonine protein kinase n=1 Tax=Anabaena subtropica FACHB-260 TaxID=2692884 RepID=A0ABR8CK66_9NOST|nr:CHASE2 domain-containing serine/threonine-protein kinase [Anabaena subtropica]MBD2343166.1 CHASE2 domain-containing protein [Anabaena subtropica FACHB-260]